MVLPVFVCLFVKLYSPVFLPSHSLCQCVSYTSNVTAKKNLVP